MNVLVPIVQGQAWNPDPAIGVDLCLTSAAVPGDLAVTPSGDLQLIGNAAPLMDLWQATILRLITTLGTYLFASNYGTLARRFIDEPMTDSVQQQLQTEITNTVLSDPRIRAITTLQVTPSQSDPQGYRVKLGIVAVSSNQVIGGLFTIAAVNPQSSIRYARWNFFNFNDGSVYYR